MVGGWPRAIDGRSSSGRRLSLLDARSLKVKDRHSVVEETVTESVRMEPNKSGHGHFQVAVNPGAPNASERIVSFIGVAALARSLEGRWSMVNGRWFTNGDGWSALDARRRFNAA